MTEELKQHLKDEKSTIDAQPKKKRGRPKKVRPDETSTNSSESETHKESENISFQPCPATAMIYKITVETAFNAFILKNKRKISLEQDQCLQVSGALRYILDHYSVSMSPLMMAFSAVAFNLGSVYISQVMPLQMDMAEQEAKTVEVNSTEQENA